METRSPIIRNKVHIKELITEHTREQRKDPKRVAAVLLLHLLSRLVHTIVLHCELNWRRRTRQQ